MNNNWWSCNGRGERGESQHASSPHPLIASSVTRRSVLLGAGLAAVAWAARGASALADVAVTPGRQEPQGDVLVTLFLRGGADGLNIVIPHGEDAYHRLRPSIGLASP